MLPFYSHPSCCTFGGGLSISVKLFGQPFAFARNFLYKKQEEKKKLPVDDNDDDEKCQLHERGYSLASLGIMVISMLWPTIPNMGQMMVVDQRGCLYSWEFDTFFGQIFSNLPPPSLRKLDYRACSGILISEIPSE